MGMDIYLEKRSKETKELTDVGEWGNREDILNWFEKHVGKLKNTEYVIVPESILRKFQYEMLQLSFQHAPEDPEEWSDLEEHYAFSARCASRALEWLTNDSDAEIVVMAWW